MPPQPPMGSRKNAGAAIHGSQTATGRGWDVEHAWREGFARERMAGR